MKAIPMTMKCISNTLTTPLSKYLAQAGYCSRRQALEVIAQGAVTINGSPTINPAERVFERDVVKVGNKRILSQEKIYILLNKPKGLITTVSDDLDRKTIMDLLIDAPKVRFYPVGRLDHDTTGLLLVTNDGNVAQRLSHPSNRVKKTYVVTLDKPVDPVHLEEIKKGIRLYDGLITVDSAHFIHPRIREKVKVTLHSGKNRIVRRIFGHFGYHVHDLDRRGYASLIKEGLPSGRWRFLTKGEIMELTKQKKNIKKSAQ